MIIIDKKTERIKFWMTDKEAKQFERQAEKLGMNRSEYIRQLIRNARLIHTPDIDFERYYSVFKELSDEFNRYLKALNVTGIFNEKKADIVCRKIIELQKQFDDELTEKMNAEIQKSKGGKG